LSINTASKTGKEAGKMSMAEQILGYLIGLAAVLDAGLLLLAAM
jgi:hypothetical protein